MKGSPFRMEFNNSEYEDDKFYAQLRAKGSIYTCNYHFYLHDNILIIIKRVNGTVKGVYEGKPSVALVQDWINFNGWDDLRFCAYCGLPIQHGYYCAEFNEYYCNFHDFESCMDLKNFELWFIDCDPLDGQDFAFHFRERNSSVTEVATGAVFEFD